MACETFRTLSYDLPYTPDWARRPEVCVCMYVYGVVCLQKLSILLDVIQAHCYGFKCQNDIEHFT